MRRISTLTLAAVAVIILPAFEIHAQSSTQGSATRGAGSSGRGAGSSGQRAGSATQGSATQGSGSATAQPVADNSFEGRFWRYLTNSPFRYDEWAPFAGRTAAAYKGQSPHGAYVKVIANKLARQNPLQLPYGSILIKENYAADSRTLLAITVMYRTRGANGQPWDPENRDWYYVKYTPAGEVAFSPPEMGSKRLAGRVQSCIDCHSGAGAKDFVFLNDDLK
ncbi:MAG: cytochrome P460 family protein [Planctomycetota bacterium]|nr:cytochrome P460 family protein [Planctomycetota bacterium]MDA0918913.1 cytochrome P460 family protein [Planctomycetota bacterium]MDA1159196.1 cytochrome P460 family protein [Planctomycetota bacterium]